MFASILLPVLATTSPLQWDQFPPIPIPEHHPIREKEGQQISLRGFWYRLSESEGLLSSQPNLKSCCLRSAAKMNQQVVIKNIRREIPLHQIVTLEGTFHISPEYDGKNQLTQLYVLTLTD